MRLGAVLLFVLIGACGRRPATDDVKGQLDIQWNGSKAGHVSGAASAGWCPDRRMLEIRMVHGDTGVALVLYPGKTLGAGVYPVIDPARADSTPPSAGIAVRWLAQTTVQGFQGDSGRVTLERAGTGQLSGRVAARARSVVDTQRIRLTGMFRNLTITTDTIGCDSADTTDRVADPEAPRPEDTEEDIGVD